MADKEVTMQEVEDSFGGNICRCTGYRPILSAFKSLATDAPPELKNQVKDIEELYNMKICPKSGKTCSGKCSDSEDDDSEDDFVHINSNGTEIGTPLIELALDGARWVKATMLSDVFNILSKSDDVPYVFAGGNTARGVYRPTVQPKLYIDIQDIPELKSYSTEPVLTFGANMSLNAVMKLFNTVSKKKSVYSYTEVLAKHIDLIAHVAVRNIGTIAGNLTIKHQHHEFPSDIFLILETVGATLTIVSKDYTYKDVTVLDFLDMDMHHKVIKSVTLPPLDESYRLQTYKIMPRAQNAHAFVNAGFLFQIKKNSKGKVLNRPRIVYGGISPYFVHAINTEGFMDSRSLFDAKDMKSGLRMLETEIQPDYVLPATTPVFRKRLALALFYKFILSLSPTGVPERILSGGKDLVRPLSSAKQNFETKTSRWPLTKPMPKLEAFAQCSGEAVYLNDMPPIPGETFAAFVLTSVGQGFISDIDPSEALKIPGVVRFFSAVDIPGNNNFTPLHFSGFFTEFEEVFCGGKIKYAGQPLGLIVAETQAIALSAVPKVKVSYTNVEKPHINIRDIIASGDKTRVRVEKEATSINKDLPGRNDVAHVIKGTFDTGTQYHFTMETQQCICVPTEDGIDVYPSTQWMDLAQVAMSQALNIPASSINVFVRRVGGAYGGKISRNALISTACGLAAYVLNRPVRLLMTLESNMEAIGKRNEVAVNYEAGTDNDGKILYLKGDYYENAGSSWNESVVPTTIGFMQSCYDNSNWKIRGLSVRSDIPSATWCRAPGSTEGIVTIEHILEHIAKAIKKDPTQVKLNNMMKGDEKTPQMVNDIKNSAQYDVRKQSIDEFNKNNRWIKRGIALVPVKYEIVYADTRSALVSIFAQDGTVAVTCGGIEFGQGLNTKVAQAVAYTLGIDLSMVKIKPCASLTAPNNTHTGGSRTSELSAFAAVECCKELLKRMEPAKQGLKDPTWVQWVQAAYGQSIDLCASHMFPYKDDVKNYFAFAVTVCEVEIDFLTGRHQILRVDILEDAGESMNPELDIGQIEGGFVMGLGYWLTEYVVYDPDTGKLLTNRTWNYKPPGARDIPIDFRIELQRNVPNPFGVLRAKAIGEPPMTIACCVLFALRYALASARAEVGKPDEWFNLDLPATVEHVFLAGLTDVENLTF